jgi:MBOAT, membrane-bound O-acyltransferase family
MSGLGYNGLGPDGKKRWNRCRNIDILNIEFANNWKELLDAWNMNTSESYPILFLLPRQLMDIFWCRCLAPKQRLQTPGTARQEGRLQDHHGDIPHQRLLAWRRPWVLL